MKTSDILRNNKEHILQYWMKQVKEDVPKSKQQNATALRDDLPDLIDDIAVSVDTDQPEQNTHNSFDHGRLRAAFENYTLSDVVREYRVLMQVLLDVVDEQGIVSISDRDKVIFLITRAIEGAAEVFYQTRQEESEQAKEQAEQMAARLEEEGQLRDNFIGSVTHDLRNPMANTLSLVDMLRTTTDEAVKNKAMDAIQTSMEQADTLIRNLLDANLVKAGATLPVSIERCDIMPTVRAAVEGFSESHGQSIQLTNAPPSQTVCCDAEALRRALDNLISNAIKYGTGDVSVSVEKSSSSQPVRFSVHNWGNPISEEQQSEVFSRYYRVAGQRAPSGWGIGLSLVKGIAEAHEGQVTLSSSSAEGTTFAIHIPPCATPEAS
ncbi:MAG: HAMP domain-containing sensor histidine kinase [Tunicatimonas sp.]